MKRVLSLLTSLLFISSIQASHCCMQPYMGWNQPGCCYNIPCVDTCNWLGFNGFYGEFLYWNLYSDELRWATKHTSVGTTTTTGTDDQTAYVHKFDFSPGFRLGCHHIFPCTENDMVLNWTYYWNSQSSSAEAMSVVGTTTAQLVSPYIESVTLDTLAVNTDQTFNSNLTYRLNRLDFTFGQNAQLIDCVVINYYGGGVFWAADEDLFVHGSYEQGTTVFRDEKNQLTTAYRGAGAQVGIRLNWNLWRGLALSVNGGFAGTVGPYDLKENITAVFLTDPTDPTTTFTSTANNPISYWTGRYASNVGIVVRYTLCLDRCVFYSSIGWEYFHYFNQTSFQVRSADLTNGTNPQNGFTQAPSDLQLHGLTFTLGTTF